MPIPSTEANRASRCPYLGILMKLACLPLLLLPAVVPQDEDPVLGYHLAEAPGFASITHWHSERCAERLPQEVVETAAQAWLEAQAWLGLEARVPEPAVTLEVFENRRSWVEAVLGRAGVRPGARESWLDGATVLVPVNPPQADRVYADFGLPPTTLRLAAEGAVLAALIQRMPEIAEHAPWVLAGVATEAAQRALVSREKSKPVEEEPRFARLRSILLRDLLGDGEARGWPDLAVAPTAREWSDSHGTLAHLLVSRRAKELPALLADGAAFASADALTLLGGDEPQQEVLNLLFDAKPAWQERTPELCGTAQGWYQAALQGETAIAFRTEPCGMQSYRIEGEVMLFPTERGTGQMNVLFGLAEDGSYFSLAITEINGITIFFYDPKERTYFQLEELRDVEVRAMDATRYVLEIKDDRLFIVVNGRSAPAVELGGRDLTGAWGFGAQRKAAGMWLRHEVKPIDS